MNQALIEAENDRIDDLVDIWHQCETGVSLAQFLGMTQDEYWLWLRDCDAYSEAKLLQDSQLGPAETR